MRLQRGAHPKILERLLETNLEQTPGYGKDEHCERAKTLIRQACGLPQSTIEFVSGGTQANQIVIAAILKPYQGVVCADTGHINTHETGAVEATGHKVLALPSKRRENHRPADRQAVRRPLDRPQPRAHGPARPGLPLPAHRAGHSVHQGGAEGHPPGVLAAAHPPVHRRGPVRLRPGRPGERRDPGRPGPALRRVLHRGTKVGALLGEAVVIPNLAIQRDFRYMVKRMGGMLAKGRLLGIQFEVLFEDGLYFQLGRQAVEQARRIRDTFQTCGVEMAFDSPHQPAVPRPHPGAAGGPGQKYSFNHWGDLENGRSVVRFCTSWATTPQAVEELCRDIHAICGNA